MDGDTDGIAKSFDVLLEGTPSGQARLRDPTGFAADLARRMHSTDKCFVLVSQVLPAELMAPELLEAIKEREDTSPLHVIFVSGARCTSSERLTSFLDGTRSLKRSLVEILVCPDEWLPAAGLSYAVADCREVLLAKWLGPAEVEVVSLRGPREIERADRLIEIALTFGTAPQGPEDYRTVGEAALASAAELGSAGDILRLFDELYGRYEAWFDEALETDQRLVSDLPAEEGKPGDYAENIPPGP